ncbi:hypothetical protein ACOSQ2_030137 [Xanthoceras sorbifolium]|uniref:Ribosomal protein S24e family protein n=1 Tax=Xanthoceras sorbifolium TaxID=99658 RepID=A0ABQ8HAE0_9ROSI|nr:hypothetical protein JRO89_XS12G0014000 [Xanthoceras sorbifolium]
MNLLRNAIQSNISLRAIKPTQGLPFLLRESPRRFSTETEQPPPPAVDSSTDPFLQTPNEGLVYGKLFPVTKYTLQTDIINLLEGCKLTRDDVKVNYSRNFMPMAMLVQFPSRHAFDNAIRMLNRKGRLYRLEKIDRSDWDSLMPYNGKTVVLEGIPINALHDDVERFLAGCECDSSSIQMFQRSSRMATVHFPSQTQAMNAFLTKNRGFCLNNQISVRVLQ